MPDDKICPFTGKPCMKKQCGLWSTLHDCCAIAAIADELYVTASAYV